MIMHTEFKAIAELDLDPIKVKLMHNESGEGWSLDYASQVEFEYRRFLYLMKKYPTEQTAPLFDVDIFWHYHILDTMKYAADCDNVFGYFLHHFPYIGLRGEEDEAAHQRIGARMGQLYEDTFGGPCRLAAPQPSLPACSDQGAEDPDQAQDMKTAYSAAVTRSGIKTAYSAAVAMSEMKTAYSAAVARPEMKTAYSAAVARPEMKTAYSAAVARPEMKTAYSAAVARPEMKTAYSAAVARPEMKTAYSAAVASAGMKTAYSAAAPQGRAHSFYSMRPVLAAA